MDITEIIFNYYRGIVLLQSGLPGIRLGVENQGIIFNQPYYMNSQNIDRQIDFFTTSRIGLFLAVVI